MIRYLIKNNFKLMFRNTWSIVTMLLGPILVIAVLSSAFSEMMKSYEGVDEFTVGYRVEKDSPMADYVEMIQEAGEETGITFYEYPQGAPEDIIAKNELAGFVEFTEDEYVIYKSADYEVEGITLEYFLSRVMSESTNAILQMMSKAMVQGIAQENFEQMTSDVSEENVTSQISDKADKVDITLPATELNFLPAVDSTDYYGIIYIVYFCWCGMICATGVLSNEKKYGIERKFQVSKLSNFQMYMGKLVPITLTVTVGMAIATIITILLYDIHWGNPMLSSLIVFLMILAGAAFGMMLYNLSDNLVITIIALFTVIWFMGFFGGSFETYMFSSMPDIAKQLSPLYHGNRALVELSCIGESDYVVSSVIYSLSITVVCSVIAVLASGIRKRGRA